jgi:hypothetical protein
MPPSFMMQSPISKRHWYKSEDTSVSKVVDFRRLLCRSGVSPDIEGLTIAGVTPVPPSRRPNGIGACLGGRKLQRSKGMRYAWKDTTLGDLDLSLHAEELQEHLHARLSWKHLRDYCPDTTERSL